MKKHFLSLAAVSVWVINPIAAIASTPKSNSPLKVHDLLSTFALSCESESFKALASTLKSKNLLQQELPEADLQLSETEVTLKDPAIKISVSENGFTAFIDGKMYTSKDVCSLVTQHLSLEKKTARFSLMDLIIPKAHAAGLFAGDSLAKYLIGAAGVAGVLAGIAYRKKLGKWAIPLIGVSGFLAGMSFFGGGKKTLKKFSTLEKEKIEQLNCSRGSFTLITETRILSVVSAPAPGTVKIVDKKGRTLVSDSETKKDPIARKFYLDIASRCTNAYQAKDLLTEILDQRDYANTLASSVYTSSGEGAGRWAASQ